jgi:hypothetical protein
LCLQQFNREGPDWIERIERIESYLYCIELVVSSPALEILLTLQTLPPQTPLLQTGESSYIPE